MIFRSLVWKNLTAHSPDLNPIQHLRDEMEHNGTQTDSLVAEWEQLLRAFTEDWRPTFNAHGLFDTHIRCHVWVFKHFVMVPTYFRPHGVCNTVLIGMQLLFLQHLWMHHEDLKTLIKTLNRPYLCLQLDDSVLQCVTIHL